jgi:hypothetical protein
MKYNLGIDLGWTIVGNRDTGDRYELAHNAFEVIKAIKPYFNDVYIISKVNSEQKERSLKWIKDVDFFNSTGISPNNLYYCFERRDKAIFVRGLGITHFIDDKAEVLSHLDKDVAKVLFNPNEDDLTKYKNKLFNTWVTKDWLEIANLLDIGNLRKNKVEDLSNIKLTTVKINYTIV